MISDEDDSSAPEESTDTSVTNPDDAQNTTDTNPSGGGHSTDSSTDSHKLMEMYRREQRIFPVELYRIPINQSLPEEVLKAAVQAEESR